MVRFDGMRFSPVEALRQASLGDIWARAIEEDTAGRVWITSNDLNLIRLEKDNTGNYSAKVFTEKDGLTTKDFSCLVPGPNGEMWTCAATGLLRIQGEEFDFHAFPGTLEDASDYGVPDPGWDRVGGRRIGGSLLERLGVFAHRVAVRKRRFSHPLASLHGSGSLDRHDQRAGADQGWTGKPLHDQGRARRQCHFAGPVAQRRSLGGHAQRVRCSPAQRRD